MRENRGKPIENYKKPSGRTRNIPGTFKRSSESSQRLPKRSKVSPRGPPRPSPGIMKMMMTAMRIKMVMVTLVSFLRNIDMTK